MASRGVSGALDVAGDVNHGTLFLQEGDLAFALLAGDDVAATAARHIDESAWMDVTRHPRPESDLGTQLIKAGVTEEDLVAFAHELVDRAVTALRRNAIMSIDRSDRRSPLGSCVRLDVSRWFDPQVADSMPFGIYPLTRIA